MNRSRRLAVLAGCLLAACAPSFDPVAEEARLLQRDAEWSAASAAGTDVEKIVSFWTEDALVFPPGQPVAEGKAAIRRFVSDSLRIPGFSIRWSSEKPVFSPDGKVAYMRATNEVTVPGPDGKPVTLRGRGLTVWRREADGVWRCAVDIWNEGAPPPAPSS